MDKELSGCSDSKSGNAVGNNPAHSREWELDCL